MFQEGNVLYGKLRPYLQNWLLPSFDGLAVGDFWVLRPKNADSSFLYRLIQSRQFDEVANQSTGTKMPRADWKLVSKTIFFIPSSIDEQAAIGTYLEHFDRLITLHQRECTKLKNIKNITLTKMIKSIPDLKFSKFTNVWEQRKVSELFRVTRGYVLAATQTETTKTDEKPYPVYSSQTKDKGLMGYYKDYLYEDAITWTTDGANAGTVNYRTGKFYCTNVCGVLLSNEVKANQMIAEALNSVAKGYVSYVGNPKLMNNVMADIVIQIPTQAEEREQLSSFFAKLDNLITLHQRECKNQNGRCHMLSEVVTTDLFCDYYIQWVKVYKEGAVRKVTLDKYMMTYSWLLKLASHLRLCDITRVTYQQILNDYAITHEKQTTMDFHHQLKGAIADAVDDGLITKDPTRKAIIKGKTPTPKKIKYLNQYELHTLLSNLQLKDEINWDWLILLVAKTGMRFSEALAITPSDFDFAHQMLSISKTWNYKGNGGFLPTKNKSSVRKIQLDWQTVIQFSELVKRLPPEKPIFITKERVYNSTVNDVLARHCTKNNIPVISIHGLRHTHASLLLFAGVSIASVARRLGHSSMTTTQKTYLHIIQELENKDIDLVMRSLSGLS